MGLINLMCILILFLFSLRLAMSEKGMLHPLQIAAVAKRLGYNTGLRGIRFEEELMMKP